MVDRVITICAILVFFFTLIGFVAEAQYELGMGDGYKLGYVAASL